MPVHRNNIIPASPFRTGVEDELDLEAICVFVALGFFLGDRTYYKGLREHLPASTTETDADGRVLSSRSHFEWHYTPRDIPFRQAVDEFTEIFEAIIAEGVGKGYTIPISGGLDSRTLVAACEHLRLPYQGYSYMFRNGIDETRYGRIMAKRLGFPFQAFTVEPGSLWGYIDRMAERNQCYSEFTHGRQYACHSQLNALGGTFLLGHGGDLFFDGMGVDDRMGEDGLLAEIWRRLVKPSGLALAESLWREWGLAGDCRTHLREQLAAAVQGIRIHEANPRLRAFKTMYYVARWTCVNLSIFRDFGPNVIPYFDDRICRFICTVPEQWLASRKIQIEYLKRRSPALASVVWQDHRPYNLYTYPLDRAPLNYPYRAYRKLVRTITRADTVRRNWENQFLGADNARQLHHHLLGDDALRSLVPTQIIETTLRRFLEEDPVGQYNAMTMLVTLASFRRLRKTPITSMAVADEPEHSGS